MPRRVLPHSTIAVLLLAILLSEEAAPAQQSPRARTTARAEDRREGAAEEEFLKTNALFNRGLHDLAAPRYRKLLEDHPRFEKRAMAHYALALSCRALAGSAEAERRAELLREAVLHAERALGEAGLESRADALRVLARSLLELGRHDAAVKAFEKLLAEAGESGGDQAAAAAGLADARYQRGDAAGAVELYRRAIDLFGKDGDRAERDRLTFHLALSLYQLEEKEVREGLSHFRELADRGGDLRLDSLYMAALSQGKLGEHAAALSLFDRLAVSGESRWEELGLYGRGTTLFQAGDFERSAAAMQSLIERFPSSPHREQARLHLARAMLRLGKLRDGARLLNTLRASDAVGAEAGLWLARAYASTGKHSAAVKIIEAALSRQPRGPHAEVLQLELAIELLADRRFPECAAQLRSFLERHPESDARDHAAYLQAYALHQAGEYGTSDAACARFLETFPSSRFRREVRQLAAENRFLSGDHAKARSLYEAYLEEFRDALSAADRVIAEYRIAEARYFEGDLRGAREALERLGAPGSREALERAMGENPLLESFHYLLGDACYRLDDHEAAVRELGAYLRREAPRHAGDARFKLAHALQLQGDRDGARRAYSELLATDPETPHRAQVRFELAQMALDEKRRDEAAAAFRAVVDEAPRSRIAPHACHFLGWIAQQEGRHEEAAEWFRKVTLDFPGHELEPEAQYLLALSLQALSRFDEARAVLTRIETDHPGAGYGPRIRLQEAVALARQGQRAQAIGLLEGLRSTSLPPRQKVLLLYELAWCHRDTGDPAQARSTYREILRVPGDDPGPLAPGGGGGDGDDLRSAARLELAELELEAGEVRSAKELLAPLATMPGETGEKALYRLSWCHYRERDIDALAAAGRSLEERHPSSPRVHEASILLARLLVETKRFGEAAKIFERIATSRAGTDEGDLALVSWGESLNEERKFADSRRTLELHLRRYPESPYAERARFALGWAAESQGDIDDALGHYKEATAGASAVSARAQFQIGQCLAAKKRYEDAIVEFLQVTTRYGFPEWSSRAVLQVAGCFEALDRPDRAREYYSEVIRDYPARDEARLAKQRLEKIQ